jgi:DNA polymerase lambda
MSGGGIDSPRADQYRLYFLKKGTDMAEIHIEGRKDKIQGLKEHAKLREAKVLDEFDPKADAENLPTHIVVSNASLSATSIAEALGFASLEDFFSFLNAHSIQVVTRRWADKGNAFWRPPFAPPLISKHELHHAFITPRAQVQSSPRSPMQSVRNVRPKVDSTAVLGQRVSSQGASPPATTAAVPIGPQISSQGVAPPQPITVAAPKSIPVASFRKNQELSDLFRDMAKLYQSAPLEDGDGFKALSFSTTSSRLKRLPFEVNDSESVNKISGFGLSTREIIQEYLDTNSCRRLIELQTDPDRVRMRLFMNIWGVGKVRARELAAVAKSIEDLKRGLDAGRIKLDRNQLIGLECYDDILEEMSRDEVEKIFEIVKDCVLNRFPSAELSLMGSYRRGVKATCGDADILITHPDHVQGVPPKFLGTIVDELCTQGHIAFHLTYIAGMKPANFETLPEKFKQYMTDPIHYGRAAEKKDKAFGSSTTYMGVFNSPVVPGRRRRVDIKFYPYQERAFATLYFTGNGHFNRSMRLWSDRKKNATLNDRGLFEKGTDSRVRDKSGKEFLPTTEREIFDWLGLAWKEPNDRDGFDAVEAVDGEVFHVTHLSKMEEKLEAEHEWIK